MASVRVELLDHLGLIAAVSKDVGLIDRIQTRLVPDAQEDLTPMQARHFETPKTAQATLAQSWKYHQVATSRLSEHKHYVRQGRPMPTTPLQSMHWQIHAQGWPDHEWIAYRKQQGACFVIGTNIATRPLSDREGIQAYKAQAQAEGGFLLLKAPLFFVSSLFVKKPCRIQGLLMVMTLALLVEAVTQRRLRQQLVGQGKTVPN